MNCVRALRQSSLPVAGSNAARNDLPSSTSQLSTSRPSSIAREQAGQWLAPQFAAVEVVGNQSPPRVIHAHALAVGRGRSGGGMVFLVNLPGLVGADALAPKNFSVAAIHRERDEFSLFHCR